jgi:hypothetical protein
MPISTNWPISMQISLFDDFHEIHDFGDNSSGVLVTLLVVWSVP